MKRYSLWGFEAEIEEEPNGEYVKHDDVLAIVAENDELKKENKLLLDEVTKLRAFANKAATIQRRHPCTVDDGDDAGYGRVDGWNECLDAIGPIP